MRGLDEWITGHYGEDQYDDIFCPKCFRNVDQTGYSEEEGFFASGIVIWRCDECGALVQDGEWLSKSEARVMWCD